MNDTLYPLNPILIVDDETQILVSLSRVLKAAGMNNILCCNESTQVIEIINEKKVGLVLLDLTMPYISGEKLLPIIKEDFPDTSIIIITGLNEVETAIRCMKMGASDYLVKSIENQKLITAVTNALKIRELREENLNLKQYFFSHILKHPKIFSNIITTSDSMKKLFLYVESISKTNLPIQISGESGTGKELIAQCIHSLSGRKGNYIVVNAAGLDDSVFADTLFGHKKGAFTSADTVREGLIKKAAFGTLFLDEIGDLSASSQIKLLRLLETHEYYPLGSDFVERANARIITATNKNLSDLVVQKKFRSDLYYRLRVYEIKVPPLRERFEDLPVLIHHFIHQASQEIGVKVTNIPPQLYTLLETYHFPGNIRELKAMVFEAVSRHIRGTLSLNCFREKLGHINDSHLSGHYTARKINEPIFIIKDKFPTLRQISELAIKEALKRAKNNQSIAASLLGITQSALNKRLKRLIGHH
ncbi:MAG: sigma-54-dependent transcriptional regulator [bacterium]